MCTISYTTFLGQAIKILSEHFHNFFLYVSSGPKATLFGFHLKNILSPIILTVSVYMFVSCVVIFLIKFSTFFYYKFLQVYSVFCIQDVIIIVEMSNQGLYFPKDAFLINSAVWNSPFSR